MLAETMEKTGSKTINFLLAGVGGQGTILASNVLAEVGLKLGYDAKQAEVHGMSQRGGSVTSHLRWSTEVFSPIIPQGEAGVLIAFEKMEAARYIHHLKPGGLVLINNYRIIPVTVSSGQTSYPQDEAINAMITPVTSRIYWIEGLEIAAAVGNTKTANIVMLGALCALLGSKPDVWVEVIESQVPQKWKAANRAAFEQGYRLTEVHSE